MFRKITRAVAGILAGRQGTLVLGHLDARRDWGDAPEYVEGMGRLLQQEAPADLVFGTGRTHSVREFVEAACGSVKLDWRDSVSVDPRDFRPPEVERLQADPSEATRRLGWEARGTVRDVIRVMVDAELDAIGWPAPGDGTRSVSDGRLGWLGRP